MITRLLGLDRFQGYSIGSLQKDLVAGLIVGIVALPLGMAFAISSGVKPEYGIYTTIIAGILASLIGGSRFAITGPTGAFIPVLFGIASVYGYENLLIAGFMAGVMLLLMGLLRIGTIIKFFPKPVVIGFTTGIGVIIFSSQISDFLGLSGVKKHEFFHENIVEIFTHLVTVNVYSVITAALCLTIIILMTKFLPKIPGALVGLLVSTVVATIFYPDQVATIGSKFGGIPSTLPSLQIPQINMDKIVELMGPAFTIAMLGAIESLLCAVVADGMTGSKHNSNRELIGQGLANMITPLFGGIAATGAIARTATNIKNGGVSPLSGIIHGVVVLAVLLLLSPFASLIPMASMAPVLMVVAWNMSERKEFAHILMTKTYDSIVLLLTFVLTVFIDLTTAVEFGLVCAVILFIKQMNSVHSVLKVSPDTKFNKVVPERVAKGSACPQISMFTLEGPLFFATTQALEDSVSKELESGQKTILLRMSKVPYLDTSGEAVLVDVIKKIHKNGGKLLVSGIRQQPKSLLERTGSYEGIGASHFFEHTGQAINYALTRLDFNKCKGCKHFAFKECAELSNPPKRSKLEKPNEPEKQKELVLT
ncbi:SulP family inorganic anion transporter [Paenibacillus sedimenti]|uniref:STAS domain-containing protein n=1 Tax=Paenibacillus sedimenti TaxID=2770274 RepID=A0A926QK23_9BACL|nr:SulP family inorganic anion transporter [Paenibacillus sedimenti]MBD0381039.1 STAS domain-containing protein [Paenibacillus sedimenti]